MRASKARTRPRPWRSRWTASARDARLGEALRGCPPTRWVGESGVAAPDVRLQRLQLAKQPVVLGVRDLRIIEDVVAVVVVVQLAAQLLGARSSHIAVQQLGCHRRGLQHLVEDHQVAGLAMELTEDRETGAGKSVHVLEREGAGLDQIGHAEQRLPVGRVAAGAMEDIHLAGVEPALLGGVEDLCAGEGAVGQVTKSWISTSDVCSPSAGATADGPTEGEPSSTSV
jgi:hypothetical protein